MTAAKTWIDEFPGNFVWSNAALVTKGMAPYSAVAIGEIDEVCERLRPRQGASRTRGRRSGARWAGAWKPSATRPRPRATR